MVVLMAARSDGGDAVWYLMLGSEVRSASHGLVWVQLSTRNTAPELALGRLFSLASLCPFFRCKAGLALGTCTAGGWFAHQASLHGHASRLRAILHSM